MQFVVAVFAVCIAAVSCQAQSQSASGPPSSMTKPVNYQLQKGCSPGCSPTGICCELEDSYCKPGQRCSVCVKMSSIRFPAAAISGMFKTPSAPAAGAAPQMPAAGSGGLPGAGFPQQRPRQSQSGFSSFLLPAMMIGDFGLW